MMSACPPLSGTPTGKVFFHYPYSSFFPPRFLFPLFFYGLILFVLSLGLENPFSWNWALHATFQGTMSNALYDSDCPPPPLFLFSVGLEILTLLSPPTICNNISFFRNVFTNFDEIWKCWEASVLPPPSCFLIAFFCRFLPSRQRENLPESPFYYFAIS